MNPTFPPPLRVPLYPPSWAEVFGEDEAGIFAEFTVKGVRFAMRWIPPGSFRMGSPDTENGRLDREGPQHRVSITKGFWLGETPVTQDQWQAVTGENPSLFKESEDLPVEQVSWRECQYFARKVAQECPDLFARLPSEAEWEYACRAGTDSAFHDGSPGTWRAGRGPALVKLGWFADNSESRTHPVREKLPNAWGLYDTHGNVWEWCEDAWDEAVYQGRADGVENPRVISDDEEALRVVRGGSWGAGALVCRAAVRGGEDPGARWDFLGLRLAAGQ